MMVKKPQPLAQTCQSTPALALSFGPATAATRFTVVSVCICDGSDGMKLTLSVVSGVIVTGLELMLRLGSATEVAVRVTEVPVAATGGAV